MITITQQLFAVSGYEIQDVKFRQRYTAKTLKKKIFFRWLQLITYNTKPSLLALAWTLYIRIEEGK